MDRRDALIDEIAALVESRLAEPSEGRRHVRPPRRAPRSARCFACSPIGCAAARAACTTSRRGCWPGSTPTRPPILTVTRGSFQTLVRAGRVARASSSRRPRRPRPCAWAANGASVSDRARNQRERILFACAQCCYERGYVQMGIADIVSAAAVSRSVFYEHFHDKQHAALAMLEQAFELMMTDQRPRLLRAGLLARAGLGGRPRVVRGLRDVPRPVHIAASSSTRPWARLRVQLEHDRLMAFTLMLEDGYKQRPEAEQLPRVVSELIVSLLMECPYREIRRRKPPDRFYDLLPPLPIAGLAPFIGPPQASSFVQAKVEELKTEGDGVRRRDAASRASQFGRVEHEPGPVVGHVTRELHRTGPILVRQCSLRGRLSNRHERKVPLPFAAAHLKTADARRFRPACRACLEGCTCKAASIPSRASQPRAVRASRRKVRCAERF